MRTFGDRECSLGRLASLALAIVAALLGWTENAVAMAGAELAANGHADDSTYTWTTAPRADVVRGATSTPLQLPPSLRRATPMAAGGT